MDITPDHRFLGSPQPIHEQRIKEAAFDIETQFISTLMKSAGLEAERSTMGGGIGEEQFSSFLRDAQAAEITKSGGLGLAEALFTALTEGKFDHA